jgi:hypothetical protein
VTKIGRKLPDMPIGLKASRPSPARPTNVSQTYRLRQPGILNAHNRIRPAATRTEIILTMLRDEESISVLFQVWAIRKMVVAAARTTTGNKIRIIPIRARGVLLESDGMAGLAKGRGGIIARAGGRG